MNIFKMLADDALIDGILAVGRGDGEEARKSSAEEARLRKQEESE